MSNPPLDKYLREADIPGKGQGYIASRNIIRGTRILEESPFLWFKMPSKDSDPRKITSFKRKLQRMRKASRGLFSELSPAGDDDFVRFDRNTFELSGSENLEGSTTGKFLNFSTAEDLEPSVSRIFKDASLFNHSCIPNAYFAWNPDIGLDGEGRLTVHAVRDIAFGDEVVVNYRPDKSYEGRKVRMRELSRVYGFNCTCPACNTQSPIAAQSEQNRDFMKKIVNSRQLRRQNPTPIQRRTELNNLRSLLDDIKIEGIIFPQQAEIYGWLAEWCARELAQGGIVVMSREESREMGLEAAREKLKLEILCTGDRSSGVEETLDLIAQIS